jgi:hypothetical protein
MRTPVFVLLALLLSGRASSPAPGNWLQQPDNPDKKQNSAKSSQQFSPSPLAPDSSRIEKPSSPQEKKEPAATPNGILEKAFAPEMWSSWVLVLITGVGVFLALRSLRALRNQVDASKVAADASKVAADAALLQAQAAQQSAQTANRSAEIAEKSLLLTQRADILFDTVAISDTSDFGSLTELTLVFKNFGLTRARLLRLETRLFTSDTSCASPDSFAQSVVGPGDIVRCYYPALGKWVNSKTVVGILSGAIQLRYVAEISYCDVFGKRHRTRCSGVYARDLRKFMVEEDQQAD